MHSTIPNSIEDTDTLDETIEKIGRQRKTQKVMDMKRLAQTDRLKDKKTEKDKNIETEIQKQMGSL